MTPDIVRFLWEPRIRWLADQVDFDLRSRLAGLRSTPEAPRILENFVDRLLP